MKKSVQTTETLPVIKKSNIIIKGARVHNLKNVDLELPRNKLIVITGVSGSGKSSLAFDTIYAEGHRRYVESLSAYARQFLSRMEKPDVDYIQGISPAMAIQQKTNTRNPRSTVGTTTEIYDYLRLLYARIGKTFCYNCSKEVTKQSPKHVVDFLKTLPTGTKAFIAFPLHGHKGHTLKEELEVLKERGFSRVIVGDEVIDLNEKPKIKAEKSDVYVLIDRIRISETTFDDSQYSDSSETAMKEGMGRCIVKIVSGDIYRFSEAFECADCGIQYASPEPQLFSFNNPFGACPECQGFGNTMGIDMDLVIPDSTKTLADGAIHPFSTPVHAHYQKQLIQQCEKLNISTKTPWFLLEEEEREKIKKGWKGFIGIDGFFEELKEKSYKIHYRVMLSRYRGFTTCFLCNGSRLRKDVSYIKLSGKTIHDVSKMTIRSGYNWFLNIQFSDYEQQISKPILFEINKRLKYLNDVGLHYLTLNRLSSTLSGGESQRINLATSLGSSLVGSLYVLDEPSIGLHQRDSERLITILRALQKLGNTVIVVEHDPEIMRAADFIVDMGPLAGEHGGKVVFAGTYEELLKSSVSLTGKYLSGKKEIEVPKTRRPVSVEKVTVQGAMQNNLKRLTVEFPLKNFVCVTGVSGSGKSTLVHSILYAALKKERGGYNEKIGRFQTMHGSELITHVEMIDQSPIGKTPRSNPVTYLKIYDDIRALFASLPQAKLRTYTPGTFSFNVPGGRCEACQGDGVVTIEMQFLADVQLICESCNGRRFKKEVMEVKFNGKSIADVLDLTVDESIEFFKKQRKIANRLQVLSDVGLGYLHLGQSATTLSGGEAQRLKLASHLANETKEYTLFIFDEPTTGLHFEDIKKLIDCFQRLISKGNGIIVIEHNLEVIKCADWIIDLGPEGGDEGGYLVGTGTPEELAKNKGSFTGKYLKEVL